MIDAPRLVWGAMDWLAVALAATGVFLVLLIVGYRRAKIASLGVRLVAASLKIAAILILAACLLEPLFSGQRARPGANNSPSSPTTARA